MKEQAGGQPGSQSKREKKTIKLFLHLINHSINFFDWLMDEERRAIDSFKSSLSWLCLFLLSSSLSLPSFLSLFDGGVGRQKRRRKISWLKRAVGYEPEAPLAQPNSNQRISQFFSFRQLCSFNLIEERRIVDWINWIRKEMCWLIEKMGWNEVKIDWSGLAGAQKT